MNNGWEAIFTNNHLHNVHYEDDMLTIIVVFAGVMLTGMLAMVINVLMSREAVTAHLVVERTARLRESEEKAHAVASEAEVARQEAEIANLAKSEFLATMSHEIRTPLNGVLGMAQLLSQSRLDEAQQMKVKTILSSGQSLLAIISDVLDMSKDIGGKS